MKNFVRMVMLTAVAVAMLVGSVSAQKLVGTANGQNNTYADDRRDGRRDGVFTDRRDGQKYRTVWIGNRVWMAENLNYLTGGSWCYGGDNSNCKTYGRLYTWDEAQYICPSGFHLPSREEWNGLVNTAGGGSAGTALKSRDGWRSQNGTDTFGFSALPGGYKKDTGNNYQYLGEGGNWWTAPDHGSGVAYHKLIGFGESFVRELNDCRNCGFSVRCVQNN